MRRFITATAAALAILPGVAHAADAACLTKSEFSELAGYALPSVIGGARERCALVLRPEAFLPRDGETLIARYSERQAKTWPTAKAAFLKLSSKSDGKTDGILRMLPDETLREMLNLVIEGLVSQEIPTEKCETIDEFARLLAPLPPENTAELLALIVALAGKPKEGSAGTNAIGKLAICQE